MGKTYTIKPLEWAGDLESFMGTQGASTPFGSYDVGYHWNLEPQEGDREDGRTGRCFWGYCFDEYYDEEQNDCESIEDGKRLAEAHWIERISRALDVKKARK